MSDDMRNQLSFEFKETVKSDPQKNKNDCKIKSIDEKRNQKKKEEESKTLAKVIARAEHLFG